VIKMDDEEEYGMFEDDEGGRDPQWRGLVPKERRELMKNIFGKGDWYEENAQPFFEGGTANPLFEQISERVGAPVREVKRYYAAWLNQKGLNAESALTGPAQQSSILDEPSGMRQFVASESQGQGGQGGHGGAMGAAMDAPPPQFMQMPQGAEKSSDAMSMMAMMQFLT